MTVESPPITTLDGVETGRYIITTSHGTRHFVDLDAKTLIRKGAAGGEWASSGMGFGPVTEDGAPFHFWGIDGATVGQRMRLSNKDEWRITSLVQSIEPWEDAP